MRPYQILIATIFCLFSVQVQAQEEFVIKGTVSDAESGDTLPFANIFLANTTYGTSSAEDGSFMISVSESGTYDLVISFLGYETFARSIRFTLPDTVTVDARMVTKNARVAGVTVTAKKDKLWRDRLWRFKRDFLGTSVNGKACKILNEEALNFEFDQETGVFEAYANEPLIIENKKLGYRLNYVLEDFRIFRRQGFSTFYGFTSFEDLDKSRAKKRPKRRSRGNVKAELSKFDKSRDKAYLGSQQHFFSTLYRGTTNEEGYELYRAIDEGGVRVIEKGQVKLEDIIIQGDTDQTKQLKFQDYLYIYFKNEKLPLEYLEFKARSFRVNRTELKNSQNSWIQMREQDTTVTFEANGYVRNPLSFYSYGYWAFEKVGDMMPINYQPTGTKK